MTDGSMAAVRDATTADMKVESLAESSVVHLVETTVDSTVDSKAGSWDGLSVDL
jgi:hypothetical protein